MTQLDDLTTAVARVGTDQSRIATDILAAIALIQAEGGDNPVIADAITALGASADQLEASATAIEALTNPPPTP